MPDFDTDRFVLMAGKQLQEPDLILLVELRVLVWYHHENFFCENWLGASRTRMFVVCSCLLHFPLPIWHTLTLAGY